MPGIPCIWQVAPDDLAYVRGGYSPRTGRASGTAHKDGLVFRFKPFANDTRALPRPGTPVVVQITRDERDTYSVPRRRGVGPPTGAGAGDGDGDGDRPAVGADGGDLDPGDAARPETTDNAVDHLPVVPDPQHGMAGTRTVVRVYVPTEPLRVANPPHLHLVRGTTRRTGMGASTSAEVVPQEAVLATGTSSSATGNHGTWHRLVLVQPGQTVLVREHRVSNAGHESSRVLADLFVPAAPAAAAVPA